jgi:hypothetical protein
MRGPAAFALAFVLGATTAASPAEPPAAFQPFNPLLLVTEPAALAELEAGGLDAGALAFGRPAARSLAELGASPDWASIAGVLRADIAELYASDSKYGVGMRRTHRGFDPAWLTSPAARLELAAVVNRIDRRVFHPGTCGELRFVYRMAYTATGKNAFSSRLPFTLNVVMFVPDDGKRCATRARGLLRPGDVATLAKSGLPLKSLEVNLQTSRWPSTIRPDLGGHADYLLRVFHPAATAGSRPRPWRTCPTSTASCAIRSDAARSTLGCGHPARWRRSIAGPRSCPSPCSRRAR